MSEQLSDTIERIELGELIIGEVVQITTGVGENAFMYIFDVEEPGNWPKGQLSETRPDGATSGPSPVVLHGSGRWTTRQQNPVQTQERAFTSYFDSVSLGEFLVEAETDAKIGDRLIFDKPGQEISKIAIIKA